MPDSEFDCDAFFDTTPPPVSMFRAKGCPGVMESSIDEDGVETITKVDGDDGSYDRGLAGIEAITTIGAVEFQLIYAGPTSGQFFFSLTKTQLQCGYPGSTGIEDYGVVLFFGSGGGEYVPQSWTIDASGFVDAVVVHSATLSSSNIYKLTLSAGVWKFYLNGSLVRTFVFDSLGDPMKMNIAAAHLGTTIKVLRFSNSAVF